MVCSSNSSALLPAPSPSNRMESGRSSATLTVLVPIEPVLPSRTTFFIAWPSNDSVALPFAFQIVAKLLRHPRPRIPFTPRSHVSHFTFYVLRPGQNMPEVQIHDRGIKQQAVQQVEDAPNPRE